MSGPPIEELREDYGRSQKATLARTLTSKAESEKPNSNSPHVVTPQISVNELHSDDVEVQVDHDLVEDYDSEVDMIKGVFYEDEEGTLRQVV